MTSINNLDPYTFYFELPLYNKIKLTSQDDQRLLDFIGFNETIDAFGPHLKENTTYRIYKFRFNSSDYFYQYGGMERSNLKCLRTGVEFSVFFYYDTERLEIQKVGQFPSIADFHISQIRKYQKVLSKEKLKEFTRAIGLASNGVGIGSFVYLRRIFEDLIEEAHSLAKKVSGWDEKHYSKQRMAKRIELLKNYLPDFLVENKTLYQILSVGIHSLNEQDCLAYYETVRVGIELILDEKLEELKKKENIENAKKKISSVTSKIKKVSDS